MGVGTRYKEGFGIGIGIGMEGGGQTEAARGEQAASFCPLTLGRERFGSCVMSAANFGVPAWVFRSRTLLGDPGPGPLSIGIGATRSKMDLYQYRLTNMIPIN